MKRAGAGTTGNPTIYFRPSGTGVIGVLLRLLF